MSAALLESLAVACELTGTHFSKSASKLLAEELAKYPEAQVLGALRKCCRELKGRLTLAEILSRLDDGRPGVEEAWSLISQVLANEQESIAWTEEMREAYAVVAPLAADPIAARMAFKERYAALLSQGRDRREPVKWSVSLGYDPTGRELALQEAVRKNQISQAHAAALVPHLEPVSPAVQALITQVGK